jgi:hypothetical protein
MNESVSEQPISFFQVVAAYVGIDWADQKLDVRMEVWTENSIPFVF